MEQSNKPKSERKILFRKLRKFYSKVTTHVTFRLSPLAKEVTVLIKFQAHRNTPLPEFVS